MTDAHPTGWSVLRFRDFRHFCAARFLTGMAQQVHNVGLGWLVYERTGSVMALGLVGLAAFVPALVLALVAGAVADRYDRRLIMVVCWSAISLGDIALLAVALDPALPVWPIFVLTVLVGGARSFANPASQALLPNLVPKPYFPHAVTMATSAWQISSIAGPALGGLLYAVGPGAVFGFSAASFALAVIAIATVTPREQGGPNRARPTLESLLAGIGFIRSRPVILGAMSLDLFAVLLGGAAALLPVYAKDILQTGPLGLGVLRSAPAVGAIGMTLFMTSFPLRRRAGPRMFAAVATFGLGTIVFGLSTSFWLSAAALVVVGAADMVSVVVRQTLVQTETPDDMRGRVSAVNSVFIGASNELGEFESGALAAAIGPVGSVVLGGIGTVVVAGLWIRLFPALWKRDALV